MNDDLFAELETAFKSHDADGNGTLDKAEFIALLRDLGSELTDAQIDVGFALVDEDDSGRISLGELGRWWSIVREEAKA